MSVLSLVGQGKDLAKTQLLLSSSVAPFTWVWWIHKVTLATLTAVGVVRVTGYRTFHLGSRF